MYLLSELKVSLDTSGDGTRYAFMPPIRLTLEEVRGVFDDCPVERHPSRHGWFVLGGVPVAQQLVLLGEFAANREWSMCHID